MSTRHVGTHHRHLISYAHSGSQSLYSLVLVPLLAVACAAFLLNQFTHTVAPTSITFNAVVLALLATFVRLIIAYTLALICAVPLSIWITHSQKAERILLPLFDILQSVPILAFFPVVIVFFAHYGLYSTAAVFILFISMLWSIVFSLVGGLHSIPQDVKSVGKVFGLKGFAYADHILLPAVFPYLITGSLLAFAGGWNIVAVAEVLHTYLPGSSANIDIVGIGSILVHAAARGDESSFMIAIAALVGTIALLNVFVWQRLLKYAERYKFD